MHVGEGLDHYPLQTVVDVVLIPEKFLQVLNPLEVGDGDTASIGEDVGDHQDAPLMKNGIGVGSGGAVGSFGHDARLDAVGILQGDLVLQGGGNQDVALKFE